MGKRHSSKHRSARANPRMWIALTVLLVAVAAVFAIPSLLAEPGFDPASSGTERAERVAAEASAAKNGENTARAAEAVATPSSGVAPAAGGPPQVLARDQFVVRVVEAATGRPVEGATVVAACVERAPRSARERRQAARLGDHAQNVLFGQRAITDAEGRAVLEIGNRADISAAKQGWFGAAMVTADEIGPEGFVLQVRPSRTVTARLLDLDGRPCADVPLALVAVYTRGELRDDTEMSNVGRTDDAGEVLIRIGEFLRPGTAPRRIEVQVEAPGMTGVRAPVADQDDVVVLRLPAHGSVRVRANDRAGRAIADDPGWSVVLRGPGALAGADGDSETSVAWLVSGCDGEAFFPVVGLGFQVSIEAAVGDSHQSASIAGPIRGGQEVEHTLTVDDACFRITGRLLASDGVPFPNTAITIVGDGWTRSGGWTDAEGRFRAAFQGRGEERTATVSLMVAPRGRAPAHVERVALRLDAPADLGDLILTEMTPIARGTIVQALPRSPGLALYVQESDDNGWRGTNSFRTVILDDAFAVYRVRPGPSRRLRLVVRAPGCIPVDPIEFVEGQQLTLELVPGAHILVRLAVDPAIAWYTDRVEFDLRIAEASSEGGAEGGNLVGCHLVGHEWVYESYSYRPGVYRVAIEPGDESVNLGALDDVRVGLGEPDARVLPWDLRDAMQLLTVKAFSPDGAPLKADGYVSRRHELAGEWEECASIENGVGYCLLPKVPSDLFVDFHEHGVARCSGVMGALNVTVRPPTKATIRIVNMPRLVDGAPILAELVPAPEWWLVRGLPEGATAIVNTEWDRAKSALRVEVCQPVDATVMFLRGESGAEIEGAFARCALSPGTTDVPVTLSPAALAALAPWTAPK